jgi:hypothetical protein
MMVLLIRPLNAPSFLQEFSEAVFLGLGMESLLGEEEVCS